jgi:cytochrome c biogenesis protein CcdA/thiol-disulfide isomerase/thioredoxin
MLVLIGVAFVAGIVTALSPCVLPILPLVLAGGATGSKRRPYAIVAGLVASFTAFSLAATALLSALGLPDDLLRNIAIAAVFVVGLALIFPRIADVVARPFRATGRWAPSDVGGGFFLGASIGVLCTPCAGPIIAAIATVAATQRLSFAAVLITLSYALGVGLVLLGVALAGRRGFGLGAVRSKARVVRPVIGVVIAGAAVVMLLGLDLRLRTRVPEYTRALQRLERTSAVEDAIAGLLGNRAVEDRTLRDFGPAPEFEGITDWLNSEPLRLDALRGKVVLIDFWTYSCINCLRTLPYVKRWYETYRSDGLVVVGVHTPEFAFERVKGNVEWAVDSFGLEYPVALDNSYETWDAWHNRYWPAKYFIDRRGHVRFAHFGEGAYEESERIIRKLLAESDLPDLVSRTVDGETPVGVQTPETYLGFARLDRFAGPTVVKDRQAAYRLPAVLPADHVAYGGNWTVEDERIVAGPNARLQLRYHARKVYLVAGPSGEAATIDVFVDSLRVGRVAVDSYRLYTLAVRPGPASDHLLELRFSPGTEAYAFTFG